MRVADSKWIPAKYAHYLAVLQQVVAVLLIDSGCVVASEYLATPRTIKCKLSHNYLFSRIRLLCTRL